MKLPNFRHVAVWVMLPMRVLRQSDVHPSGGLVNYREHLPSTPFVNKGKKRGRGCYAPALPRAS